MSAVGRSALPSPVPAGEGAAAILPPLLFILIYTATLLLTATRIAADPIDDRLLAPLFPPAIIVLTIATYQMVQWRRQHLLGTPVQVGAAGLACVWLVITAVASARVVRDHLTENVAGYASPAWRASPTRAGPGALPSPRSPGGGPPTNGARASGGR